MMRSATAFLPDSMITFMNFERWTEPNLGSGRMSRLGTSRRRGISFPSVQLAQAGGLRRGGHLGRHRPLVPSTYSMAPKAPPRQPAGDAARGNWQRLTAGQTF